MKYALESSKLDYEVDPGEGKVLVSEEWPPLTYMIVHFEGIEGPRIISQMYDPYFYMEGDAYENWGENRELVLDWLERDDIRLMYFQAVKERYVKLVEREPEFFEEVKKDRGFFYYLVDQEALRARERAETS